MSKQNSALLEDTRALHLRERTDVLLDETVETLIWEAERVTETPVPPERDRRQLKPSYPQWPTSTPGPQVTLPLPSMKPVSTRTDQMVYEDYDQERGLPRIPVIERPERPSMRLHPVTEQVRAGQHVYDAQGARVGKILVRWPGYMLVERGLIFRRTYYVSLLLVQAVEGERVRLEVSEATLVEQGYTNPPADLYHRAGPSAEVVFPDISGASRLGKFPPTPAETGHYHYGPLGPGINTDASGSYAPYEIDPYGQSVDRPVKPFSTSKLLHSRTL